MNNETATNNSDNTTEIKVKVRFVFSIPNQQMLDKIIKHYPPTRQASAVMAALYIAQNQNRGWISPSAIETIAELLDMAAIRVYEVASFYSMFNLTPIGEYHLQVCGTTPCWLRGASDILGICHDKLGLNPGETSADGKFTVTEVECLGACVNGPVVQINNDYYEDLDITNFSKLLDEMAAGKEIKVGSQIGRKCSAPKE